MEQALENLSKEELIKRLVSANKTIFSKGREIISNGKLIESQRQDILQLAAQVAMLKRMKFGSKSERFMNQKIDPNQKSLSFEELQDKIIEKEDKTVKEINKKKKKTPRVNHKGRNKLPDHLEVKEIIIEPSESTEGLVKIGEERSEVLEYIPGRFFKIITIRPKYALKNNEGVLIADLPSRPIEKCLAGNILLTYILISKYVDHLPLYRQQQIFKRLDVIIASSTIDGWITKLGNLLEPLYLKMIESVKKAYYLQADETPTKVLDSNKKGSCHQGYYWVYHAPKQNMVIFDYRKGRRKEDVLPMLGDYKGYLQTDGYGAYKQFMNKQEVTHLACWAHARRYFDQALDQDKIRAEYALTEIQKLYEIERQIKDLPNEKKKETRIKEALPILNNLGVWITKENNLVLPKSAIGKAFIYATNQWDSLLSYLYDGELIIDNNLIENSIRPNALGRKNYLFAGSHEGAKRSAMFYSFMGTCKMNNVEPQQWLAKVLETINDCKTNDLHKLFPQNFKTEFPVK